MNGMRSWSGIQSRRFSIGCTMTSSPLKTLPEDKLCPCAAEADDDRRDCEATTIQLMKHRAKRTASECSVFDEDDGTSSDLLGQIIELLFERLETGTRTMPDQLSVCIEQSVDVEDQTFAFWIRVGNLWACAEHRLLTEVSDAAYQPAPRFCAGVRSSRSCRS